MDEQDQAVENYNDKKLFVGNLPFSITNTELVALFSPFGKVIGINIREDRATNKPKGFAFVTYEDADSASEALDQMNNLTYEGRTLTVKRATLRGGDSHASTTPVDTSWKTIPTPKRPPDIYDKKTGLKINNKSDKTLVKKATWENWTGLDKVNK